MDREKMFKIQLLSHQAEQLQEHLSKADEQIEQIETVLQALEELKECKGGEEVLMPLTNGIFVRGIMAKEKGCLVNVGDGTVVEKSLDETKKLLEEQKEEIVEFRTHAMIQIQEIIERVGAMDDVQGTKG